MILLPVATQAPFVEGDLRIGVVLTAGLGSLPLAPLLCFVAFGAYRRTMARLTGQQLRRTRPDVPINTSQADAGGEPLPTMVVEVATDGAPSSRWLVQRSTTARKRAIASYGLAGAAFGVVASVIFLVPQVGRIRAAELLGLVWVVLVFGWPLVPTLATVGAMAGRSRTVLAAVTMALVMVVPVALRPSMPGVRIATASVLWLVLPSILLLAATSRPRLRGAAWLIVPVTIGFLAVAIAVLLAVTLDPARTAPGAPGRGAIVSTAAVVVVTGTLAILLTFRSYVRKSISDEALVVGQWWLVQSLFFVLILILTNRPYWPTGLLPFLVYLVVRGSCLRLLVRPTTPRQGVPLLLLRTFGYRRRSERLLRNLGAFWRRIGPIHLIGGLDLAAASLEPDEFVDLLTRRLHRRLVQRTDEVQVRVDDLDDQPDLDGRYRVNEILCADAVWPFAVQALFGVSAVVLLDVRGFTGAHTGMRQEVQRLTEHKRLDRVLAVVDDTTDRALLASTIQQAALSDPTLPGPTLKTFTIRSGSIWETRGLFASLCALVDMHEVSVQGRGVRPTPRVQ